MGINLFFTLLAVCFSPFGNCFCQDLVEMKLLDSIPVSFESGSSIIRNPSALINRINQVKILHGKIQLVSYTDTVGSRTYNQSLASKRLLSVSKLIGSTKLNTFPIDSVNQNEQRNGAKLADESFRRVDILIYRVDTKIQFNTPINLRINFHSGSDNLVTSSTKNLKILQMLLEMDTTLRIKLNGHVCCKPGLELSLARAEKVKHYLVTNGIEESRITCKGYSNTAKLVSETTDDNKRKNMRVEVVFIK